MRQTRLPLPQRSENPFNKQTAFGLFAVGYLMRPIGGAVVGRIGDKLGGSAALSFSGAPRTARSPRGWKSHPGNGRFGPVAGGRLGWVTDRVEAPRQKPLQAVERIDGP